MGSEMCIRDRARELAHRIRHGAVGGELVAALAEAEARTALAGFGLGAEAVLRPAGSLSPGERTRAELTLLAHAGANCLLLDEPGNHLDIESLELIEATLRDWPGALLVATHDDRLAAGLELRSRLELPSLSSARALRCRRRSRPRG